MLIRYWTLGVSACLHNLKAPECFFGCLLCDEGALIQDLEIKGFNPNEIAAAEAWQEKA
jgi:hypothetical protein